MEGNLRWARANPSHRRSKWNDRWPRSRIKLILEKLSPDKESEEITISWLRTKNHHSSRPFNRIERAERYWVQEHPQTTWSTLDTRWLALGKSKTSSTNKAFWVVSHSFLQVLRSLFISLRITWIILILLRQACKGPLSQLQQDLLFTTLRWQKLSSKSKISRKSFKDSSWRYLAPRMEMQTQELTVRPFIERIRQTMWIYLINYHLTTLKIWKTWATSTLLNQLLVSQ